MTFASGPLAPITIFGYNRPDHLAATLQSLRKNKLAEKSDLIIFCDGPKSNASEKDLNNIEEVRKIARAQNWAASLRVIESEQNKGLAASIINGVSEVLDEYGKIIVLEDDLLTSPYFLDFMNNALNKYASTPEVMHVSGYIFNLKKLPETFFLSAPHCWGWATWKDSWQQAIWDIEEIFARLDDQVFETMTFNDSYPDYRVQLDNNRNGKLNSWAIKWYFSVVYRKGLALHPGTSLITNNGFDEAATNTRNANGFSFQMNDRPIELKDIQLVDHPQVRQKIEKYFRSLQPSLMDKVRYKLKSIFH